MFKISIKKIKFQLKIDIFSIVFFCLYVLFRFLIETNLELYSRNVSAPLDARRLGLVLDAEILLCTPRCVGLCTAELPAVLASLPAILRRDRDDPDREPSDSG